VKVKRRNKLEQGKLIEGEGQYDWPPPKGGINGVGKHPGILRYINNYGCKKFYGTGTWFKYIQPYTVIVVAIMFL
jgi:hypothetical protein